MIDSSKEIIEKAISEIQPYAIVAMISGGKDSLCAYLVAKELGVPITHIIHGVTGTGIPETTHFVRHFTERERPMYLEASAGNSYEEYVRRKGFFGIGIQAHAFTYHILKREWFSKAVSHNIRFGKRNRPVMLINGARASESLNRGKNMPDPIRKEPNSRNYWVNIIHHWSREERDAYLEKVSAPQNPVTTLLCRSGECLCGTMQNPATRVEASYYYPKWGEWLNNLERDVKANFSWGWGEAMPKPSKEKITAGIPTFQPMCVGCLADSVQNQEIT